jgi:hypothetical protein
MDFDITDEERTVLQQISHPLEDAVAICKKGPQSKFDLMPLYNSSDLIKQLFEYFDFETKRFRAMPYDIFLKSFYWKLISEMKKEAAEWKCEQCGAWEDTTLEVHHKTYLHHGAEHRFMHELRVLCHDCHGNEHKRLEALKQAHPKEEAVRV